MLVLLHGKRRYIIPCQGSFTHCMSWRDSGTVILKLLKWRYQDCYIEESWNIETIDSSVKCGDYKFARWSAMTIFPSYLKLMRLTTPFHCLSDVLPAYIFCNFIHICLTVAQYCTVRKGLSPITCISIEMVYCLVLRSTNASMCESISSFPSNAATTLNYHKQKTSRASLLKEYSIDSDSLHTFLHSFSITMQLRYHVRSHLESFTISFKRF